MSRVETAIQRMNDLQEDDDVPTNVKDDLDRCIEALRDEDEDFSVRINTATSILDEISNDPNIAQYTRTEIWNIASMLESAGNDD